MHEFTPFNFVWIALDGKNFSLGSKLKMILCSGRKFKNRKHGLITHSCALERSLKSRDGQRG